MAKVTITPLFDRVLIKMMTEEEMRPTVAGIILPESVTGEKPQEGTVIALGSGRVGDDNEVIPMTVKKGDRVLVKKYGADEVEVDGEQYSIVEEGSILAIIG